MIGSTRRRLAAAIYLSGISLVNKVWRSRHFAGLLYGAALLVFVQAAGTVGYWYIGQPHATWIDSFYMTFITIATIGFGEIVDLSTHPLGRLFTVLIAVVGIATMSYLFSALVALLGDADSTLRANT